MITAYLKDRLDCAPRLADLHAAEWRHLYRKWNVDQALREFAGEKGDGSLPATILALDDGGDLLGSISVVYDDLPGWRHLNPWVASFYVLPEHRGCGVGSFLFSQAEAMLAANGIAQAFLFTATAEPFFAKRGWRRMRAATANGHPVVIMTNAEEGAAIPRRRARGSQPRK